ncbi:hypothetical protein K440DRAFT_631355 [Wilcoxina mikolae CBS 423.85]|nr:hypothetical protein K440DRAFT_631355 [Wilcoxina mikolae CBS 423.85]
MPPPTLLTLPNELLLLIADNLSVTITLHHLSALVLTSRHLYLLLNPTIYTLALDPDSTDRSPSRATILLNVILHERRTSISTLLLHAGSEREWVLSRLFRLALENQKEGMVREMLERGVDVDVCRDGDRLEGFLRVAKRMGMVGILGVGERGSREGCKVLVGGVRDGRLVGEDGR